MTSDDPSSANKQPSVEIPQLRVRPERASFIRARMNFGTEWHEISRRRAESHEPFDEGTRLVPRARSRNRATSYEPSTTRHRSMLYFTGLSTKSLGSAGVLFGGTRCSVACSKA
jgi:hypothetical protein